MSAAEIDEYLQALSEPKRGTLEQLRRRILEVLPESEQCISYGMPAFRVDGKVVAGFAAFTNHLAYVPHSGSVFQAMADDLSGFTYTTGSLHFPVDEPLPGRLVEKLIATRLSQLA
jgi:uncharacterized protein YdhG (YjbR/CyaY superfamily)